LEVRVVAVVAGGHNSLKLWHIVWVGEIDHIKRYVVSLQSLAQVLALFEALLNWVAAKGHDPHSLRLVLSMLKGELGDLDCGKQVGHTIDLDVGNGAHHLSIVVGLGQSDISSSARHRHDSNRVLGVLIQLEVADVVGGVLLRLPPGGVEIARARVLRIV
jgi:hypothetical protein